MYRLLSFILLMGAIALAPAVRAQDKDDPKKADDTKKVDEPKGETPKPPEKVETPKPPEKVVVATPAPPPPVVHHDDRLWYERVGDNLASVAQLLVLALIFLVLIGLRSDFNRLEEFLIKNSTPKT
jgi:hypothetical protein